MNMHGVDIDKKSIEYAVHKYPSLHFAEGDAKEIDTIYPTNTFPFIYLFNVAYAFEDKAKLCKKLASVSAIGGLLIIFDYTNKTSVNSAALKDFANKSMSIIETHVIEVVLKEAGWETYEIKNIYQLYVTWYDKLLTILTLQMPQLEQEFSRDDIATVKDTFTLLHDHLVKGKIGGTIIRAKKWIN